MLRGQIRGSVRRIVLEWVEVVFRKKREDVDNGFGGGGETMRYCVRLASGHQPESLSPEIK